jgi:hypothetical protein
MVAMDGGLLESRLDRLDYLEPQGLKPLDSSAVV